MESVQAMEIKNKRIKRPLQENPKETYKARKKNELIASGVCACVTELVEAKFQPYQSPRFCSTKTIKGFRTLGQFMILYC